MSDKVDISGLNKADVLAALYNRAQPMGMGFIHFTPEDMTREEAEKLLERGDDHQDHFGGIPGRSRLYFDYLKGRCMKVDLTEDEVDPRLFDRDYGEGALASVIAGLRASA